MDSTPRIVTATPASVLDLLKTHDFESHWPTTGRGGLTFRMWSTAAHEAVKRGLWIISSEYSEVGGTCEDENWEVDFAALEFHELRAAVESLVSTRYQHALDVPVVQVLSPAICTHAITRARDDLRRYGRASPCAAINISLQLDLLTRELCTTHHNDRSDYSVGEYLKFLDVTGWGNFRQYLWSSLTNQWRFLTVRQQYETLKDLCRARLEESNSNSIQNAVARLSRSPESGSEDGGSELSPEGLWEYFKADYDHASDNPDEDPRDKEHSQYYNCPALAAVLLTEFRSHGHPFPPLIPGGPPPTAPALPSSTHRRGSSTRRSHSPPRQDDVENYRQSRSPPPPPRRSHSLAHLSRRKHKIYTDGH